MDLKKEFNNKKNIYEKESMDEKIKNFNNKVDYKTKLLNIDSKFRNKIPKNIYSTQQIKLPTDPIQTTKDSNIIKVNYPNHNLKIGDRIIIQNVYGNMKTQNNCLYFLNNYKYAILSFSNHNIPIDYSYNKINPVDSTSLDVLKEANNILSPSNIVGNVGLQVVVGFIFLTVAYITGHLIFITYPKKVIANSNN